MDNTHDRMIGGLLLNKSVNVIAISGAELVEEARRLHGLSRVCTAAVSRLNASVSSVIARLGHTRLLA